MRRLSIPVELDDETAWSRENSAVPPEWFRRFGALITLKNLRALGICFLVLLAGMEAMGKEPEASPLLLEYGAQPGAQATYVITVFGRLKGPESLEIKATLNYTETVTKTDGINVELECRVCGQGQAGNGEGAEPAPLNLKWPVKMKRSGREVQIPILEKQEFTQIPELAVLLLFNETTRLLAFDHRPVQEGESWKSHLELKTKNAKIPVDVSSKFEGRRNHRGYPCAEIESEFEGDFSLSKIELGKVTVGLEGQQEGSLTTLFALDQGQVVRSEGHVNIELRPGPPSENEEKKEESPAAWPEEICLEFQFVRELQRMERR